MIFLLAILVLSAAGLVQLTQPDAAPIPGFKIDGPIFMGLEAYEFTVLAAATGVGLLILHAFVRMFSGGGGRVARGLVTTVMFVAIGAGGYNYRDEISQIAYRIAGEFGQPPLAQVPEQTISGERSIKIRRRKDGHFTASVTVNGNSVAMLVDTGASTVVLRQADARKLGVDTAALKFTVPVQTANGVAYAAHIRLRNVSVGPINLLSVDALVAQPGALKESLLGMTFLSRLRSYEFSGQFLTFRQ